MTRTYEIIRGIVTLALFLAAVGWLLVRWLKRSKDDPGVLITKWIVTVPLVVLSLFAVDLFNFLGPGIIVACAVILSILWAPNLGAWVAKPFAALYDGSDLSPDPRPLYSIAQALKAKGKYVEAIAEIRKQLAKFPNDFEGLMLLAGIQAENLNDLPGAEITVHHLYDQHGHTSRNVAYALNLLADWHLKFGQDREAARQDLQKIIDLYPETELSLTAAQRIAHLADTGMLLAPHDRQRIHVPEGVKYVGLLQSSEHLRPPEVNSDELAANYVSQLELHPLDTEAREKLALLYADHYQRLDLAKDQLEQLIEMPNQSAKHMAHWVNLLVDLQIRHGADFETVCETLGRIIERYPNHAAATLARNRMDLLKLELKAKEKSHAVKLGSYDQNIGLKRDLLH